MKDKYAPTWLCDNFESQYLECQYMNICSHYNSNDCQFDMSCSVRNIFREHVEPYIARVCLRGGIVEIIKNGKRKK